MWQCKIKAEKWPCFSAFVYANATHTSNEQSLNTDSHAAMKITFGSKSGQDQHLQENLKITVFSQSGECKLNILYEKKFWYSIHAHNTVIALIFSKFVLKKFQDDSRYGLASSLIQSYDVEIGN